MSQWNDGIFHSDCTQIFSKMIRECEIFMKFYGFADPSSISCRKRPWLHPLPCFSGQHYENIVQALHKDLAATLHQDGRKCLTILLCAIIDNEVTGRGTLPKNDPERRILTENCSELRISTPSPLMTPT